MTAINAEMNPEFYQGLVEIFNELRISLPWFQEQLDYEYLNYIYENKSKKRCDLIMSSQLGKYKVDRYLEEKRSGVKPTQQRPISLFSGFISELGTASQQYKDNIIPFSGKQYFSTFVSVFEERNLSSAGYTARAVRESLIKCGCIEPVEKNKLKFLSATPKPLTSNTDLIRQLSNLLHRYTSTQILNKKTENDNDNLFDRSICSFEVPEQNIDEMFSQLKTKSINFYESSFNLIESFETPGVESDFNTGLHLFFYKTKRDKR
ncbi:MAG: hypothetical protein L3J52_01365 [Proteobacteria bacterium]|nr:hypothetical protein [Pseudomonadota bacterium]